MMFFKINEIAESLGVSGETIRNWRKRFGPFLSLQTGGHHLYTARDAAVLQAIGDLLLCGDLVAFGSARRRSS